MLSPIRALFQALRERARRRPDSEFQQAAIRIAIGFGFWAYFSSDLAALDAAVREPVQFVSMLFTGIATLIAALALMRVNASPARRLFAMSLDYATCSFLLVYTGEAGSPLLAVYLWVTLGNGFRYGVSYLYVAAAMAITGFLAVLVYSPYWSEHASIGSAFLLSMIAIPLYSASLLKQLHAAIQRERAASLAKSDFLANMSHELRTPLNGVIGVAELLTKTELTKEQLELATIIGASADTLLELIDNVLDISRIEAGRVEAQLEDFDLHRLIHGLTAMMKVQADSKGLVLAAHIAPPTPDRLRGDERHLRQILVNLIGNAIKFTQQGRIDLYVRPVGRGDPQRFRFEIVDTGIGISKDVQAQIFERFTQADPTITRRFGGSGLGTTIAKQLVETLGGEIGLSSRVGEGTTFWFELPFWPQTTPVAPPFPSAPEQARVVLLAGSDLARRLQGAMRAWDVDVVVLDSGTRLREGLSERMTHGEPVRALVVERAMLPGDPASFLALLRDAPALADLPVVLIESGAASDLPRETRDGYAAVLRTPVNATLLFNAIDALGEKKMPGNVVSIAPRVALDAGSPRALRILVAEDNPINQRVVRGLLEHAGHQAFLAQDGEEALAKLESGPDYDLAILDMHMPLLSGPEVLQRWRFMEKGRLPVIMLTADARIEARTACEDAGADAFLTKPINSSALLETIARLTKPRLTSVAPAAAQGLVLDEAALDDLTRVGGSAFVADLMVNFKEESTRLMLEVEAALAAQNYGQWLDRLHMLKGGASDIGATRLAASCASAERIKPFELASNLARSRLDAVRDALVQTEAALKEYRSSKLRAEQS